MCDLDCGDPYTRILEIKLYYVFISQGFVYVLAIRMVGERLNTKSSERHSKCLSIPSAECQRLTILVSRLPCKIERQRTESGHSWSQLASHLTNTLLSSSSCSSFRLCDESSSSFLAKIHRRILPDPKRISFPTST